MKGNAHKKDYPEDKFARHFYHQHARLNQLRADKKASKRKTRQNLKKLLTFGSGYGIIIILKGVL